MSDLTQFTQVYKFFLNSIANDYRIKNIYRENQELAEDMLETWMMKAIVLFNGCEQNLEDFDETAKQFNFKMGLKEKTILCNLMLLVWMEWNINDITQMNLSLNDNDYRHYAEERNLAGKINLWSAWREKVYQDINLYQQEKTPTEFWMGGIR